MTVEQAVQAAKQRAVDRELFVVRCLEGYSCWRCPAEHYHVYDDFGMDVDQIEDNQIIAVIRDGWRID